LCKNTVDGAFDVFFPVEGRDNNADKRL